VTHRDSQAGPRAAEGRGSPTSRQIVATRDSWEYRA
jgi:hypothetical protein